MVGVVTYIQCFLSFHMYCSNFEYQCQEVYKYTNCAVIRKFTQPMTLAVWRMSQTFTVQDFKLM